VELNLTVAAFGLVLIFSFGTILTLSSSSLVWADLITPGHEEPHRRTEEESESRLSVEGGFYHEEKNFKKDRFVEDSDIRDLKNERFTAAYLKLDYKTPEYFDLNFGIGVTGYTFINDKIEEDPEAGDRENFLLRELYLQYNLSKTSFTLGRHEIGGTTFVGFYFEAFSITSHELEDVDLIFVAAKKTAEVDLPDIMDFRDVDFGNSDVGDTFYILEVTWRALPDLFSMTPYYLRQADLFDLYGAHLDLMQERKEMTMGLIVDFYMTDEDKENGIRDSEGRVTNTNVYHINPYIRAHGFTLGIGYMEADHDVGAREGDLIDDYFNPLNEGDMIYQPGAETWYGTLQWERDRLILEFAYGDTDYLDDLLPLTEREFDIRTEFEFTENLILEADFAHVDSESPEGSYNKFEIEITYEY
jgi:hypothetical protein